jgi:hypothetical protein
MAIHGNGGESEQQGWQVPRMIDNQKNSIPAGRSKRSQRRGARIAMSGSVLRSYIDAKSIEGNEAYESFSAARLEDRLDRRSVFHPLEPVVEQRQVGRGHRAIGFHAQKARDDRDVRQTKIAEEIGFVAAQCFF